MAETVNPGNTFTEGTSQPQTPAGPLVEHGPLIGVGATMGRRVLETIDWSVMDDTHAPLQTIAETLAIHDASIEADAIIMRRKMDEVDRGLMPPQQLRVFSDLNDPRDWVDIYGAMLKVFDEHGVLEAYFRPDLHPRLVEKPYTETKEGWHLNLRRPDGKGIFEVAYLAFESKKRMTDLHATKVKVNRQTIKYRATR